MLTQPCTHVSIHACTFDQMVLDGTCQFVMKHKIWNIDIKTTEVVRNMQNAKNAVQTDERGGRELHRDTKKVNKGNEVNY